MFTAKTFHIASWVPLFGVITILQVTFPQTVFQLPGYVRLSVLDFFFGLWEVLVFIWSDYNLRFLAVLFLRYFRLVVNMFGYLVLNEPDQIPEHPTITSNMAHVIIPSVEPTNPDFFRCVLSVLEKRPGWITVVTANQQQTAQAKKVLAQLPSQQCTEIAVTTGPMANKRHQLAHVLRRLAKNRDQNRDVLVVFVDDHVWWPSAKFLSAVLAPFENPKVGVVGMHKRPERARGNGFTDSLLNFIACLYLERHNFEVSASNAIDGSAFVVSGRTCVIRASIVMEDEFINGFVNEWFFFGKFGPLNPDDDNYITRYIVRKGWDIKWQNQPEALMQTSLGVTGGYKKFYAQLQRWARSQWRSNPCSIFTDRSIWRRGYIWGGILQCVTFINFALLWDASIVYLWYRSSYATFTDYHLLLLILGSKFIKIAPFFYHNPQDLWLFPFQVLFGYFHSFIKLWALLTFYDHSWGGRNLAAINAQVTGKVDDDNKRSLRSASSALSEGAQNFPRSQNRSLKSFKPLTRQHLDDSFLPGRYNVSTPWGNVNPVDAYNIPANVRESQYNSVRNARSFGDSTQHLSSNRRLQPHVNNPASSAEIDIFGISRSGTTAGYTDLSVRHVRQSLVPSAEDGRLRGRSLFREGDTSTQISISPPRTPRLSRSAHSLHTHDPDLGCIHPEQNASNARTHYYPRVPDAPRKSSIIFKKTSPVPSSDGSDSLETLRAIRESAPKLDYTRSFSRG